MDVNQYRLQRADRVIWTVIIGVAAIDLAISAAGFFNIDWVSFRKAAIGCGLLSLAGGFYSTFRRDPRLAAALLSTAQIAAFAALGAPLSYIAASTALPLWDATFVRWDRQLGLDWPTWLAAMNAHPALHKMFELAYASFAVQTTTTVVALALTGHTSRLRIFIMSFFLTTLATIAISALVPAEGAWGYLHLSAHDYPAIVPATRDLHLPVFHGLRDGTFRTLIADGAEGIITFPSLHAALGVLFTFALWPIRYLRWFGAALNILMIASTPIDGGHYFSDAIVGMIIALLCWTAANRFFNAAQATATKIRPLVITPSIVPDLMAEAPAVQQSEEIDRPKSAARTSVI